MSRRRHTPPFVMIYHSMMEGAAWADLSGNAVKLLLHMVKLYNGSNNGEIAMGERQAAAAIGAARNTAARALDDLEAHGFIVAIERGHFAVKVKHATSWRLTFQPSGNRGPTRDYRAWRPAQV